MADSGTGNSEAVVVRRGIRSCLPAQPAIIRYYLASFVKVVVALRKCSSSSSSRRAISASCCQSTAATAIDVMTAIPSFLLHAAPRRPRDGPIVVIVVRRPRRGRHGHPVKGRVARQAQRLLFYIPLQDRHSSFENPDAYTFQ
jgi:hypothetical protein